jgi:hypothetical protein
MDYANEGRSGRGEGRGVMTVKQIQKELKEPCACESTIACIALAHEGLKPSAMKLLDAVGEFREAVNNAAMQARKDTSHD